MQPKILFKTSIGEYVPASWDGNNQSGIKPTGDRVLVLPDQASELSKGGVHYTPDAVGRHTMAAEAGVVIAVGDGAFKWNSDKVTSYVGQAPQAGDRVCIERYAGQLVHGIDGQIYRLMDGASIGGIYDKPSIHNVTVLPRKKETK